MHRRHSLASTSGPEAHLEGLPLTPVSRPGNLNAMTLTNSFIAELIRDANRLDHLDDYQKRRMLERAVTTIRDMRETIGIPSGPGCDCAPYRGQRRSRTRLFGCVFGGTTSSVPL